MNIKNVDDLNLTNLRAGIEEDNPIQLANSVKAKINTLIEGFVDPSSNLPPEVKKQVESLKKLQRIYNELEVKFLEQRAALEARYQLLYEQLHTKRFEIVNGILEGNEKTLLNNGKRVPEFWVVTLTKNKEVGEEITEEDEYALRFLKDIRYRKINDPKGFVLEFIFDTNPYFTNAILTKTYHMVDESNPLLENAIGTEIEWYPGKCLTRKVIKKRALALRNVKQNAKTEECPSFFKFFDPPRIPVDGEVLDKDEEEALQNQMEKDYDLACAIRDKIIPRAVIWYTGDAKNSDEEDAMVTDEVESSIKTDVFELKNVPTEIDWKKMSGVQTLM